VLVAEVRSPRKATLIDRLGGAGAVLIATVALVSVAVAACAPLFEGSDQVDIKVYLLGGSNVFGAHLYTVILPPHSGLKFTYPPFAALVFAPLALLPRTLAMVLWDLVSVASLVALAAVSLRAARPQTPWRTAAWIGALCSAPLLLMRPVYDTLDLGQINFLLVAMVLFDLTQIAQVGRRRCPRGVLVGLAAAIKLTPLIFVPYLFLTRQFRAGVTALATFTAAGVVTAVVAPRASWTYWSTDVFLSRPGPAHFISDQNLRGFMIRLHHAVPSSAAVWGVALCVGIAGLLLATAAHRRSSNFLGVLVCATTGLLVSPITWDHHLVWVIPVLAWLALAPDRPAWGRAIAAAVVALFCAAPIWWMPHAHNHELHESALQLLVGSSFVIAEGMFLVGVGVLLAVRWRRSGRSQRPDEGAAGVTCTTGRAGLPRRLLRPLDAGT
jgi:alpha-1,2-mannosyltransferase